MLTLLRLAACYFGVRCSFVGGSPRLGFIAAHFFFTLSLRRLGGSVVWSLVFRDVLCLCFSGQVCAVVSSVFLLVLFPVREVGCLVLGSPDSVPSSACCCGSFCKIC